MSASGCDLEKFLPYVAGRSQHLTFCHRGEYATAEQSCFTGKDGRAESGQMVIGAVIIEPAGEPKKILRVTVPMGMQLVHGTRVIVDNNPPQQSTYVICFANDCMSDYEATPELIANLKKGLNLIVQAINSDATVLTWELPLADFAKAYNGPHRSHRVGRSAKVAGKENPQA
jgi:invasion protein IalB